MLRLTALPHRPIAVMQCMHGIGQPMPKICTLRPIAHLLLNNSIRGWLSSYGEQRTIGTSFVNGISVAI